MRRGKPHLPPVLLFSRPFQSEANIGGIYDLSLSLSLSPSFSPHVSPTYCERALHSSVLKSRIKNNFLQDSENHKRQLCPSVSVRESCYMSEEAH